MATADAEFYSAVSAATSSFVAFLGGFFVLRLQNYAQEWSELRRQIVNVNRSLQMAKSRADTAGTSTQGDPAEPLREVHDHQRTLAALLLARQDATFPFEIAVQFVLLTLLAWIGVVVPLQNLGGPSPDAKWEILAPVVALVLLLWIFMLGVASVALYRLKRGLKD